MMYFISKLWHRLWGRTDRDIYFLERVINIEKLVYNLGHWHLLNLKSPSVAELKSKIVVINKDLDHLIWEYDNLIMKNIK